MPKVFSRHGWWMCAALACCLSGCLFVHHRTRVVREKEALRPIRFESPEAQFAFESTVNDLRAQQEMADVSVTAVPLLFWVSTDNKLSDNAIYNDQESVCDVNSDGVITTQEASVYRTNVSAKLAAQEQAKKPPEQTAAVPAKPQAPPAVPGETTLAPPPMVVR